MQKIPLELAQPDMVLAKPVTRENGMVLIAKGTALTAVLISKLGYLDVSEIVVEGNPVDMGDGSGSEVIAKRLERLDHAFRNFGTDQYMQQVKELVRSHYVEKAAVLTAMQTPKEGGE